MASVIRVLPALVVLLACARTGSPRGDTSRADTGRIDSNQGVLAQSARDLGLSPTVQKMMDSVERQIRQNPSSPANQQLNLMTAPIGVLPLNTFESDTLQWIARSDGCAMIVRSLGPTGTTNGLGGSWVSVAEASGTIGPGLAIDVSPSPDWRRMVSITTVHMPSDSTRWKSIFENGELSSEEIRRAAERRPDGSLWLRFASVEPPEEECAGEGCAINLVSPVHGNWRAGWTADSRYLLLANRGDSARWTAIDPATRQPVSGVIATPHKLAWVTRSVAAAMESTDSIGITGGGPYRFTRHGDSIVVHGPDRNGRVAERVVGAGVPIAVTRNGQYLLAVRREAGRTRAVVYSFRLFHAMMRTSCDG